MKRVTIALSLMSLMACSVSPDPNSATLINRLDELDKQVKELQSKLKSQQTAIDEELADRSTAVNEVKALITAETTRAQVAEDALRSDLTTKINTDVLAAKTELSGAVDAEKVRALAAESTLNTDLTAAIATAKTDLTTAINAEKTRAQGAEGTITTSATALTTRVASLETKTASMTATQMDGQSSVVFSGVNLYVQSGSGTTNGTANGLGNLIIGYNERPTGSAVRTGSHNLVVGSEHSFGSYGGVVFGRNNSISGKYATVLGGTALAATTDEASIDPNDSGYGTRLTSLETDLSTLNTTVTAPTTGINARLTALNTTVTAPTTGIDARLTALTTTVTAPTTGLDARLTALNSAVTTPTTGIDARLTALDTTVTGTTGVDARLTTLTSAVMGTDGITDRVAALETKTAPITLASGTLTIGGDTTGLTSVVMTGVNVYVQNGSDSTSTLNDKGNLIIGYNESRTPATNDARTGSHNLILGQQNNFSSYGAIVAGSNNLSSNTYASVLGGSGNTASGNGAVVVTGSGNTASGTNTAIGTGNNRTQSSNLSWYNP